MATIIGIINMVFRPLFAPLTSVRPDYALFIISAVTGVVMLYLYKWTSNQSRLKEVQKKIKAHILAIQLYKTDLRMMLRSLYRVFAKNMTYLWLLLPPALFLILLVVVLVVQCYPRFQFRPLAPGETVLVKAVVKEGSDPAGVTFSAADGALTVDAGPMVVPSKREVDWRVAANSDGMHELTFTSGGESISRTLVAGSGLTGVSPAKAGFSFEGYLENPLETPVPASSAFESVTVMYPERDMNQPLMFGMNWIIYFFVVSFVVALGWKFVARVH